MQPLKSSRLAWACRRGMLELDIFLKHYLDEMYNNEPESVQLSFQRLLRETDPDLYAWLTGKETPADPELNDIVQRIRDHARRRHHT